MSRFIILNCKGTTKVVRAQFPPKHLGRKLNWTWWNIRGNQNLVSEGSGEGSASSPGESRLMPTRAHSTLRIRKKYQAEQNQKTPNILPVVVASCVVLSCVPFSLNSFWDRVCLHLVQILLKTFGLNLDVLRSGAGLALGRGWGRSCRIYAFSHPGRGPSVTEMARNNEPKETVIPFCRFRYQNCMDSFCEGIWRTSSSLSSSSSYPSLDNALVCRALFWNKWKCLYIFVLRRNSVIVVVSKTSWKWF